MKYTSLWSIQYVCVTFEWHCCVGALVQIWSICVLLMVVLLEKMSFNLHLYIRFWNVVDLGVFFYMPILKSQTKIVG